MSDVVASLTPSSLLPVDFATEEDLKIVSENVGTSWLELGQILGFSRAELERFTRTAMEGDSLSKMATEEGGSAAVLNKVAARAMLCEWQMVHSQNATFFALLGALEIVQRRDIADSLISARMAGEGITV